jgi:hypothetical protein
MERVNCFAQFCGKKPHHEDVLTRAFLVLARVIPEVHCAFLELLSKNRRSECPPLPRQQEYAPELVRFQTQAGSIGGQAKRMLSILLTDEPLEKSFHVIPRDRKPVYDGVIHYGDDWAFIIENKPHHEHVWEAQLGPSLADANEIETVEDLAVVVAWRDIVGRIGVLLADGSLHPTAETLVRDFLDYVFDNFAFLNPYQRLVLCRENKELIDERCRLVMEEITPGQVRYHTGWKHCMVFEKGASKEVALHSQKHNGEQVVVLSIHPGDTVKPARKLYDGLQADRLLGLVSGGWDIRPNFHLAFRADNLQPYPHVCMSLSKYLDFWKQNRTMICQYLIVRETTCNAFFGNFIELWKHMGLMSIEDVGEVQRLTLNSKRKTVNVCPGLNLYYRWPLTQAVQLDEECRFVDDVRAKLQQAFSCWGQDVAPYAVVP